MMADLPLPVGPTVAEVGVALGSFSKLMIQALEPASFHALDLFRLHKEKTLWGQPTALSICEGPSQVTLPRYAEETVDPIYVDAEHTYDEVKAEYGIVPVVNERVANQGWSVIGFALQKHMFCDIAIRRV